MSILNELASSLGRRDEVPNQELAVKIVADGNKNAVKELVENLENKDKNIQNDCIKTLYEIGEKAPVLVATYASEFIHLLDSKNNRMVWGAMTAINTIASLTPEKVFEALPKIMNIADNSGSVIARDHAIYILSKLANHSEYYEDCLALIAEQLMKAPVNQLPMYGELTASVIKNKDQESYKSILLKRLEDISQEPKRKRIEKIVKRLG